MNEAQDAALLSWATKLARASLAGADAPPPPGVDLEPGGVFVRVTRGEALCGFVGRLTPAPVVDTVAVMTRRALEGDPRFSGPEQGALALDIWLTGARRSIEGPDQLGFREEGVFVRSGFHRAVHLPELEPRSEDAAEFLESACIAAGLHPFAGKGEDVTMEAFAARRLGPVNRSTGIDASA